MSSLKIEGRMKSPLYVASVTSYYRSTLGTANGRRESGKRVTVEDLETVFSRHTTELYLKLRPGEGVSPVDDCAPGHVGTPVGVVKRVAGGRDGRHWLCFRTTRPLERHDGLQFDAVGRDGRRLGLGISEMRLANPPRAVCEAPAGSDVEILLPEDGAAQGVWSALKPGMKVYCSMSNAVKRMFPAPSFRPCAAGGVCTIDPEVAIAAGSVSARVASPVPVDVSVSASTEPANDPLRTEEGVRKAFGRLGGTDYRLGKVAVANPDGLFVPMSVLNDLRRSLVERLDEARRLAREGRIASVLAALEDDVPDAGLSAGAAEASVGGTLKIRAGQEIPQGEWREVVVAIGIDGKPGIGAGGSVRLALPVWTSETDFNKLRSSVKRLVREGFLKWEASDLATLRMLKALGVEDVTADWTLYARNASALAALAALGVKRFVASPENGEANNRRLAESGFDVEFLERQSTPLFVSLTPPAADGGVEGLSIFRRDGLFVTTRPSPRRFSPPHGSPVRTDISWDP